MFLVNVYIFVFVQGLGTSEIYPHFIMVLVIGKSFITQVLLFSCLAIFIKAISECSLKIP